jgi:heparan-alpha-glucosaminide N-acetyltransferase
MGKVTKSATTPHPSPRSGSENASPHGLQRLGSLDAYRGLVMLAIASHGLGINAAAKHFPHSRLWAALAHQSDHVPWVGCVFWDLIQPSFMFMVGVAMAYSYARRRERGDSYGSMLRHAVTRSLVLVALGVLLASNWSQRAQFVFVNVLAQIGLGYTFLFLLWGRRAGVQLLTALVVLIGYWTWFALYPLPGPDFDHAAVGVPADWEHLQGFAAHWDKNTNAAAAFDMWLLNRFPRSEPFVFNRGGYQTLNFIPSLATMIFGLMAGELLRGSRRGTHKLAWLVGVGLLGLVVGAALGGWGICPVVKRIWTPSWALFSAGWACLLLAGFYGSIDLCGRYRWALPVRGCAFPLIVVGMNSLLMYMMAQLAAGWTRNTLKIHLGADYAGVFGSAYAPIVEAGCVVLVFWLFCLWLYRQKVFLRV